MMPTTGRRVCMRKRASAIDEVVVRALRQALVHVGSAPAMGLDVCVDPPVQRGRMIGSGVPALHEIVARVQAVAAYSEGTLGVARARLDRGVGACCPTGSAWSRMPCVIAATALSRRIHVERS